MYFQVQGFHGTPMERKKLGYSLYTTMGLSTSLPAMTLGDMLCAGWAGWRLVGVAHRVQHPDP